MSEELGEVDFQRFWRRLQQLGLNAYESRSYVVLLGHPKFKALELAARAHVPRQKIYEVLDSLVEKGFAQVVQEKTKLFSAVEPSLAIPGYLSRKRQDLEQELTDNGRAGGALIDDLKTLYSEGQGGRGTLDFLRIVTEPAQTAAEYRRMLMTVPMDEPLLREIAQRTGGAFYKATNGEALERIFKEIDRLEKTPLKVKRYVRYREAYPSLAWAGLGFLLLPFAAAGVRMTAEP